VAKDELAAFFAQVAVESAEFNRLEENLNYSAERLRAVWPKRFPSDEIAKQYARNPRQLAMYVYGKRASLGNVTAEDGWRYRGRGLIQLTGLANYRECMMGIDDPMLLACPDRLQTKTTAALSAAWYWKRNPRISILAHDGPDDDDDADFATITRLVNGGEHGLLERRAYWKKAQQVFA
jgi:putative chitinase